jgi:hypothetical protein
VVLSNPLTNDATYGSVKFYVNPGHYDMTFTKPGYTFEPVYDFQVPEDVLTLGTMATQNANAVAITGGTATGLTTLSVDTNTLYTDIVTHRLGVRTSTPTATLHVAGQALIDSLLNTHGVTALDDPAANAIAFHSLFATGGTNRWHFFADNVLPSAFRGTVWIDGAPTGYVANLGLDVGTRVLVHDAVGIGIATVGAIGYQLHLNGTMGMPGGAGAIVNTTSGADLKADIADVTGALATLARLRPRTWRWTDPALAQVPTTGFVTEEVTAALPAWSAAGSDGTRGYREAGLSALLVGAVNDLAAQVAALTARVADLEAAQA